MNKKILVIEDDPSTLRLTKYTLEKAGYQVLTANNGLVGMKKAQSEEPDLIVLDTMLPGIDGFEICHRLRAEPETANLPILMLSAKAQEIDRDTGLKMGASDYLTKPASPSEIISRVGALLTQNTAAKSKIIALLGSKRGAGTSTLAVNVAIALSQKDKRVILVDFRLSTDGNIAEHLGLKPEPATTELLRKPMDTIDRRDLEAALAVHPTGIRVLAFPQASAENKEIPSLNADLLFEKLREMTEYLLVDLPAGSPEAAEAILTRSDFIIIVTDSKTDGLPSVRSTTAFLSGLGITQERIGAVIIDRDAIFPDVELSRMKSTIEASTGVSLLEIIPYDTKACLEPMYISTPIVLADTDCPMAWAIREVAQHILAQEEEERVHG